LPVLQVHPDELQRLADHVDVGGDQLLVRPGLAPFGHKHLDQIEDSRWVCFQDLRCGPTVRPRVPRGDINSDEFAEAGEGGAVCHGIARPLVSYSVDPSPIISAWHSGWAALLPSQSRPDSRVAVAA